MCGLVFFPIFGIALLMTAPRGVGEEKYADPKLTAKDREHWSFRKPEKCPLPQVTPAVANPIDAFIRARLDKAGLKPAPPADKLTLIRRVTLDLTGLPPTPKEVEAYLKDNAADAYERVVDRLLASPHFGERWAQHWLDVVRFADSNVFELDAERPQAWRYRDYVIDAFNSDKPYDQFVTEQIAGDELAAGRDAKEAAELWIATGLHRCGQVHVVGGNLDTAVIRQEKLTEMVNGVGSAFLGLTVGCARCHDHKFDPISAGDYYRLQAFFGAVQYTDVSFATESEREAFKKETAAINAKTEPIKKKIAAIDAPYRDKIAKSKRANLEPKYREVLAIPAAKRNAEQKKLAAETGPLLKVSWDEIIAALSPEDRDRRAALRQQLHDLESEMPPPTAAAWAIHTEKAAETFVLKRGDPHRKLISVTPAFPRIIAGGEKPKTRLELAKWIVSPDNPLTARVIVNRLWLHHFGRGIVGTPNDFGTRGERPTHPELLDWLACELVELKWSLKALHRLMVTSATYRQSSTASHGKSVDPDNRLLWRMNRQRLEAEAIRDSILAAAGTLNLQLGGVSVRVPLEQEIYDLIFTEGEPDGLWPVTPDVKQHTRRSIYLFNKRNVRLPMFEAFDQPDTLNSCADRPVSTFAPQALILMNAPFVREQGKAMAASLVKSVGSDRHKQIEALYRRAFGRVPSTEERKLALEFLDAQTETIRNRKPAGSNAPEVRALADLCVVLFNTHEFVYIP
jgi:hypothetical protein